jgi:hypothetical protein
VRGPGSIGFSRAAHFFLKFSDKGFNARRLRNVQFFTRPAALRGPPSHENPHFPRCRAARSSRQGRFFPGIGVWPPSSGQNGVANQPRQPPEPKSGAPIGPREPPEPKSGAPIWPREPPEPKSGASIGPQKPPEPKSGAPNEPQEPPEPKSGAAIGPQEPPEPKSGAPIGPWEAAGGCFS